MAWPLFKEQVSIVDVLEQGACLEGVMDWVKRHEGLIADDPDKYAEAEIKRAANADGYGNGNGNGYGYGNGNGYGDGDGNGYGDGYGDGNGYGDGYGEN